MQGNPAAKEDWWKNPKTGEVVDFIQVYYSSYYFPAFNIADSAITLGAGLLILDMFLEYKRDKKMKNEK